MLVFNYGPQYSHIMDRPIIVISLHTSKPFDDFHATANSSKNCVFSIQRRSRRQRDEELTPIRVRTSISHRYNPRSSMLQLRAYLVFKCPAVDGLPVAPGATRIAALDDEILDYAVELDVVVVSPPGELNEVAAGSGGVPVVHLDGEGAHGGLDGHLRRDAVCASKHRHRPRISDVNLISARRIIVFWG